MALPVWLSRRLGIAPTLGFNIFVLICAALSTWAAYRAARRVTRIVGCCLTFFAGVLLIAFLVMPGFDFGQREHLAAMALAPTRCVGPV
jgi:Na+/phosphate symporter